MDLAKNIKVESVSRLNPTPPRTIAASQSVGDAALRMREEKVGCLLVSDEQGQMIGILTERDILCRVMAEGKPFTLAVGDVMTPDPVCVESKEPIGAAFRRMVEGVYRHLPVVTDDRPVGILSVKQIVHYLVEHFPGTVYNLPPDPGFVQRDREGA